MQYCNWASSSLKTRSPAVAREGQPCTDCASKGWLPISGHGEKAISQRWQQVLTLLLKTTFNFNITDVTCGHLAMQAL